MLALKGEYMKRFGMLLFAVLLSTTSYAQAKELTCRIVDNSGNTSDVDAAQLTTDEDASTVFWHFNGVTAPVPAAFTSDYITWVIEMKYPRPATMHFNLNRNTGLLVGGGPNRSCSV